MSPFDIDYTVAVTVLVVGLAMVVGMRLVAAHARRHVARRTHRILKEVERQHPRSPAGVPATDPRQGPDADSHGAAPPGAAEAAVPDNR